MFDKIFHLVAPVSIFLIFQSGRLFCIAVSNYETQELGRDTSPEVMNSMSSIGERSGGKGLRFCTSSSKVMPIDQTSDRIVYSCPDILSGWQEEKNQENERQFRNDQFTAIYMLVPVNVPANELTSSPDTPKSHNLTTPSRVKSMFWGLISL